MINLDAAIAKSKRTVANQIWIGPTVFVYKGRIDFTPIRFFQSLEQYNHTIKLVYPILDYTQARMKLGLDQFDKLSYFGFNAVPVKISWDLIRGKAEWVREFVNGVLYIGGMTREDQTEFVRFLQRVNDPVRLVHAQPLIKGMCEGFDEARRNITRLIEGM